MESSAPYRTLGQGEMLNWYRIERILGRGGFGVIYFALDTNLDHHVAIKEYVPGDIARRDGDSRVLPLTEELGEEYHRGLERFIDEARNLVRFRHPNIVRVMSVFQENNTAYMVMEFEQGVELREYLATVPGARDEATLKRLLGPIVKGLAEVHRHGFVHRDIKPSNILVRDDGSPVLLDFGSARNAGRLGATQNLTALVSAGYAPLEQYGGEGNDGQQGPWTDIYALGGVLYHAISGSDPVDSTRRASAVFNGGRDPLLPATLVGQGHYDDAFLRAIDWALSFRIADRPQTLSDWLPALMSGTRPAGELPLPSFGSTTVVSRRGVDRPHALTRPAGPSPGTTSAAAGVATGHRVDTSGPGTSAARAPTGGRVRRTAVALAVAAVLGGTLWFVSGDSRVIEFVAGQRVADGADEAARAREAESTRAVEAERLAEREAARVAEETRLAEAARAADEREAARVTEQARLAEATRRQREQDAADAREAERARREQANRKSEAEAARVAEAEAKAEADAEVEARAEAEAKAEAEAARAARAVEVARLVRERRAREAEAAEREAEREAERKEAARAIEAARRAEEQKAREAATARAEAARVARAAEATVERPPATRPLARAVSDDDIGFVMGRFEALRQAIASRDASAMDALTEPSPQNRLFRQLMGDYVELDVAIGDIRVRNADQAITATLAIRGMVRENGDRALPSDAYAEREIVSVRRGDEWSTIDW